MQTATPTISKSGNKITVTNVAIGSSVSLYRNNTFYQTQTASMSNVIFSGLPNGSYYAVATESGKDASPNSNTANVNITPAVTITANFHTINITGIQAGVIVGVYRAENNSAYGQVTAEGTTCSFNDVPNGSYYVKVKNPTQEISEPSNTVVINVSKTDSPILTVNRHDVVVTNEYPVGTIIKLFNINGDFISTLTV